MSRYECDKKVWKLLPAVLDPRKEKEIRKSEFVARVSLNPT